MKTYRAIIANMNNSFGIVAVLEMTVLEIPPLIKLIVLLTVALWEMNVDLPSESLPKPHKSYQPSAEKEHGGGFGDGSLHIC